MHINHCARGSFSSGPQIEFQDHSQPPPDLSIFNLSPVQLLPFEVQILASFHQLFSFSPFTPTTVTSAISNPLQRYVRKSMCRGVQDARLLSS